MAHATVAHALAHGFDQSGQQKKIVLEKRIPRHFPALRRHTQDYFEAAFGRRMGAHAFELFVERGFGDSTFLDVNYEPVIVPNETDVQPFFDLVPLAADHDAIAVPIRLPAGNDRLNHRLGQASNALKQIGNLFVFEPELRRVIDVLILAAAALAEVTARRRNAFGRGFQDSEQPRSRKLLFHFDDFDFDIFPHHDKRDEEDEVIHARQALAAEGDVANRDGESAPERGAWRLRCGVAYRALSWQAAGRQSSLDLPGSLRDTRTVGRSSGRLPVP